MRNSHYRLVALALYCCLILTGCRDIVVNVPEPEPAAPSIQGVWAGEFGQYDANGDETTDPSLTRRKDSIRVSIGATDDNYAVHGTWEISVWSYILSDWSTASYAFSSSLIDTGGGTYSMRLYVNQGSAIYELWEQDGRLAMYRPDTGYFHLIDRVMV